MPEPVWGIFVFVFGAVIGSFLNVCIRRIPAEESLVRPGSHCPSCSAPIRFYDNVPILSYILLRGRCRSCGVGIAIEYPLVEAAAAVAALALYLKSGLGLDFVVNFLLVASLIVVTFIDLRHRIIPDVISLPGIGVGFAAYVTMAVAGAEGPFLPELMRGAIQSLGGILLGGGILLAIAAGYHGVTGKEGMGGGDIKLLAMIGAFFGWKGVVVTLLTGSLVGSVVGIVLIVFMGKSRRYAVPFGPFLSLGALVHLFIGEALIRWYIATLTAA